ncbi:hypothetical protein [Citrobacter sp. R-1.5.2]|uniref:hypothetical protein n=1 Tax=Citrobacter sp. R-1.5.2 TaxID=3046183 RepID=UPI002B248D11|nr:MULTISPECIES: hypothetical protein [Citrobacter]MEB1083171.1 hypothetical protein [Citrobacter portucalensis]MEB2421244.1 hypothetical protein [Citrobacter sp. R-1.5.2]
MILITSAAYVEHEFVTEIGLIPPSFLPVQNRRLYELQVEFLRSQNLDEDIYLSVPESFNINSYDAVKIKNLGVRIIRVPDDISLGESILYSWNTTASYHDTFKILHGDTFFINMTLSSHNELSVHENRGFYKRASIKKLHNPSTNLEESHTNTEWMKDNNLVLSGYFSFNEPLFFIKSLIENKFDFVKSIYTYHNAHSMDLNSSGQWLDLGHINSFFNSRTYLTTQRVFNDLKISKRIVFKKSSTKGKKIYAEGNWFNTIPPSMRLHVPQLLSLIKGENNYENSEYCLEYLYLLPLSDLFVFGSLPLSSWEEILISIKNVINGLHSYTTDDCSLASLNELYLHKTLERLDEYSQISSDNLILVDKKFTYSTEHDPLTIIELAKKSAAFINNATKHDVSIVHGDFCFSNLLFDSRISAIKCIDPRGIDAAGNLTIYGDRRYDLAKLYHSVVGYYDLIISGRYDIIKSEDQFDIKFFLDEVYQESIEIKFKEIILAGLGYSENEIVAITIHLFLSMLPLHSDSPDRQIAFIANAFRLYKKLIKG